MSESERIHAEAAPKRRSTALSRLCQRLSGVAAFESQLRDAALIESTET